MSRRSFSVYSAKMNVAGDNIANASTPGFSRRRLTLAAQPSAGGGIFMQSPLWRCWQWCYGSKL